MWQWGGIFFISASVRFAHEQTTIYLKCLLKEKKRHCISLRRQSDGVHQDLQFIHETMHIRWFHTFQVAKTEQNSFHFLNCVHAFGFRPVDSPHFSPDQKTSQTSSKQNTSVVHPLSETFKFVQCWCPSPNEKKKKRAEKVFKISCGFWELFIPSRSVIFPIHLTDLNAS